ncbi:MAG: glycosyltransferase family 9 protein [Gammaproteobacteria bacterium]
MDNILVVRNDKLGDFMLSYPALALLRAHLPDAQITVLVPEYTRELALACPSVDKLLIDPGPARGWRGTWTLAGRLRRKRFDALIALFSTGRTALAGLLAGIPYRLAPATKLAQFLYTNRLLQRRSQSQKPEFMYNLELAAHFLHTQKIGVSEFPAPPFLHFDEAEVATLREGFCAEYGIDPARRLVFLHTGSGGSANNLSAEQYAKLGRALAPADGDVTVVLTAGPGELEGARAVSRLLGDAPHVVFESTEGLKRFARHIQFAELFISGSTGPLHIAGALDVPTAAFYPRRRSATALRWQTLNSPERRLAFWPPEGAGESDMGEIDIEAAAQQIKERLLKKP